MGMSQASAPRPFLSLILGGARSGKSRVAEARITSLPQPWIYLATCEPRDKEMAERIAHHRDRRGGGWITREEPIDIVEVLDEAPPGVPMLIDCLTLWLTNVMLAEYDVSGECDRLVTRLEANDRPLVIVSNEVGLGIVPDNALARAFRDQAGLINQRVAAIADEVVMVAAGLPLKLK
ncbi:Bifunctional adenosylcobalamin biosynthesis protein CobP [Hyphomicrobiales bacterium]|nr:Bifunctional adenosylcobalamin biosynthesis protein CobP [Hyphomicrobiales bacterium]CAH1683926.1 Bifunctional adenosylcobalamin biosynthesis protein CobP [Hyphomicrobiales bacterium]